jgi:hypothetical protein
MKHTARWPAHAVLIAVLAVALIAGHGVVLYLFSSYFAASAAVTTTVVLLVIAKHLGLIGAALSWLRRRRRR